MSTYVSDEIDGRSTSLWALPAAALEDENQLLREALRRFPIAAFAADKSRKLLPLNPAAERLFDDEALQRDLLDAYAMHPIARMIRAADRSSIAEPGSSETVTFPSGNHYRVRISAPRDGSSRGWLLLMVDRECAAVPQDAILEQWRLTPREREIATCLLEGRTTKEICVLSSIAANTLRTHVRRILEKSRVHTRAAFVARVLGARS